MHIHQIFRYPQKKNQEIERIDGFPNFSFHTDFPGGNFVMMEAGINPIGICKRKNALRTPAILTSSSPHKIGSMDTPWQDFYNVDKGHIRYFGDNKSHVDKPENRSGNKALLKQFEIHNSSDPEIRKHACPIIFFKRVPVNNKVKGYVEFNGFGVITNVERIVQHNRKTNLDFVNYCFDFAVLEMSSENEEFNWEWINLRRNKNIAINETLEKAPKAWKVWINKGNKNLNSIRRNVSKLNVLSTSEQKPLAGSKEMKTLKAIYDFYSQSPSSKKRFENLASIVTEHLIRKSANYKSGWITRGSGDSGIDFIGRIDVGSGFGSAKVLVLGQAKCERLESPTGGNHIARTVAKLKRGWLGVYITTSYFSDPVQIEILEDKYPILLINGKKLSQEVNEIIIENGYKNIHEYLIDIDSKYEGAIKYRDPEEILFD
ncbi:restriction endonuclease [Candidatus Thioglobus sp.]|nr:restriction endonuclease [Candidatus Thioglobus sp.]